ncbi:MAG TPA: alpha-hydroxy-acid oxidizing protein [Saprospiraceae bacterium]|nr:alpha-hydroxy-acid oxidizing protein [Saprospiraceae bacterium]
MKFNARKRHREIFTKGSVGIKSVIPTDHFALEQAAKKMLGKSEFDYIATGAGIEQGMSNNRAAFLDYKLIPKMANGCSDISLNTTLFTREQIPAPFLFAPIGVLKLAHPQGDLELAKAARASGIPMIFSNQASYPMEQCTQVLEGSPHWFQLYFSRSNELVESFIHRAEQSQCSAIVLTLDTTILGWRTRDLDNAYLPFIYGQGIAQYSSDPVFLRLMQEQKKASEEKNPFKLRSLALLHSMIQHFPGPFFSKLRSKDPIKAVKKFIEIYSRPNLNWEDILWLRNQTKLPLILKGIQDPHDAQRAIDMGINAIIVSNHGGRQVDYNRASLHSLIEIRKKIDSKFPLLLDSGIRTGTDVFIARALGAQAVLLGRPYTYALALGGAEGVLEYVKNIAAELEITMSLCGCQNINDITQDYIQYIAGK